MFRMRVKLLTQLYGAVYDQHLLTAKPIVTRMMSDETISEDYTQSFSSRSRAGKSSSWSDVSSGDSTKHSSSDSRSTSSSSLRKRNLIKVKGDTSSSSAGAGDQSNKSDMTTRMKKTDISDTEGVTGEWRDPLTTKIQLANPPGEDEHHNISML